MAMGDDSRARNRVDYETNLARNHLDNLRTGMVIPQAQNAQNWYDLSKERSFNDYDNTMEQFRNFSQTGGYTRGDLSNIRSRALSPLRAVYSNANREVDRHRALQGGYSPGFGVLKARMAREQSQGMSDAATNAEAQIAQMVNEGRRFGTQGQASLYGTSPGLAGHFGQMQNATMNNWLQTQGLTQGLGQNAIQGQIEAGKMPGKWEMWGNRIGQIGNTIGNFATIPWGGIGGAGNTGYATRSGGFPG